MSEHALGNELDTAPPLSEAGRARRERMLPLLERAMVGRVRRRRLMRVGAGSAVVLLAAVVLIWAWPGTPGAAPSHQDIARADPVPSANGSLAMRYASFHVVQTTPEPSAIVEVDDETLLRELRAIGHPTGLIRTRGEVMLTADIGIKPDDSDEKPGRL